MIAKEAVVAEHLSFLNVIVLSIGSTSAVDDPRFRICTKRDNDKVESLLRENSTIISVKSYRPYPSIACLILQFSAIRWLPYLDAEEVAVQKDVNALLAKQQADGGWSQTDDMTSDAYATGTVLTALQAVGRLPGDHPAVVSGCRYLLNSRLEDGTWHVVTHAKPIQSYYESGFPHGADQFISITATAWATLALAGTLPELKAVAKPDLIEIRHMLD